MLKTDFGKFVDDSAGSTTLKQKILEKLSYATSLPFPDQNISALSTSKFDIYESIKPLIGFGRVASIIPCGESNFRSYKKLKIQPSIIPLAISIFFLGWTIIEMILGFGMMQQVVKLAAQGPSIMTYVSHSRIPMEALIRAYLYIHFIRKSDLLFGVLETWTIVSSEVGLKADKGLRFVAIILFVFMVPTICLMAAYVFFMLTVLIGHGYGQAPENFSRLRAIYKQPWFLWNKIVPYNPIFMIIYFVTFFYNSLPRVYVQTLVIFFSRALSFQFRKLIEDATNCKTSAMYLVDLGNKDKKFWSDLVQKYETVCLLVKAVNEFLSPLIFATTTFSIYNVCKQLYGALSHTTKITELSTLFAVGTAIEVVQYFIMIVYATNVNAYAIKILDVWRKCPRQYYHDTEVSRREHQVAAGHTIAFTGQGWYFITKRFLVKILNAIFTIEIVMLQCDDIVKPQQSS